MIVVEVSSAVLFSTCKIIFYLVLHRNGTL